MLLLGLELAARPPGWKGASSFTGKSNMPAGIVLSLPKFSVPLPNAGGLGDEVETDAGAGVV